MNKKVIVPVVVVVVLVLVVLAVVYGPVMFENILRMHGMR